MLEFNINQYVKIKPTRLGLELFVEWYNTHLKGTEHQTDIKKVEWHKDSNGHLQMQMHEFMECFGPIVGPDFDKYCSTTIKLNEKDLIDKTAKV